MDNQATTSVGILDEFQTELAQCWRRLPNKTFFFVLLAAWLALFQFRGNSILGYIHTSSLFAWMYEAYNTPNTVSDDAIGNIIPFLVLGVLWWKRNDLLAEPLKIWLPGLLIVFAAMVVHILGYLLQEPHVSIVALFLGIYGLTGLAWGWGWLQRSFFPFFLFIFSVPLGNYAAYITTKLQLLVCRLVEIVTHFFGLHVLRAGTQLSDPTGAYQYEVAAACSGIRSLFAIFLLATVYGFIMFRSPWKRLLMMAAAFPLAVLSNLFRLLCIIVAAEIGGQSAGNSVHDGGPLGIWSLLPYVPAIAGVLYLGNFLEKRKAEPLKHE